MTRLQKPTNCDTLIVGAHLATFAEANDYGIIPDGALAIQNGRIAWIGPKKDLPAGLKALKECDLSGHWLTPGLIDCHTHLVYAGNRANEFAARLEGASYQSIAAQGGGILSTVRATRNATEAELLAESLPRLDAFLAEGVTTLEVKSGYGLDFDNERKILRVANRLPQERPVSIIKTFLGAHATPPEYPQSDDYLATIIETMLPQLASENLIDAVDGFCEHIAFSPAQIRRLFEAAQALGIPVKLHAEQLSNQGGSALAAEFQALSVDHLEYLDETGIAALQRSQTVAVLLPAAFYYLRETKLPPVAALRTARIPIAIGSDCNPGTAPITSLLTTLNFACTLFRLTPLEALQGVTRNAALALGLSDRGSLIPGKRADLAIWRIGHPQELCYHIGYNPCIGRLLAEQAPFS